MRVLIANYRYFVSSGPERYLFNLKRRLDEAGHDVAPFSVRYARNEATPYDRFFVSPLGGEDDVYFDQHKSSPGALGRTLARLFYSHEVERAIGRMADAFRPDVAYILYYLRKLSPALLVGLKKRGVPIVVRLSDYGMFCPEHHCLRDSAPCTACLDDRSASVRYGCVKGSRAISTLDAAATAFHHWRGYFDLIDAFVVTNSFMREMMIRAGVAAARLHCIPTFTDTDAFAPPATELKQNYLLCLGRLDPPKGIDVLIDAMALLKGRLGGRTPQLKIVGAGHQRRYVERLHAAVVERGLSDVVYFHGEARADETADLFRGAMATIIPALWFENLPNSLIESMACGTPVIASNIGSLAASVRDDVDGLLAAPGDAADFAAKLDRLIGDDALRRRLGAGARQAALTRFSGAAHVAQLLNLFAAVGAPRASTTYGLAPAAPSIGELS
ncbi:MAG TPA: glycosyltransferase family 4 protein [Caulobacterales bacterium]|nr:glycosyltransferase family 4 protein [Caulobacterales bacterium]